MNISELMRDAGVESTDEVHHAIMKIFSHPSLPECSKINSMIASKMQRLNCFHRAVDRSVKNRNQGFGFTTGFGNGHAGKLNSEIRTKGLRLLHSRFSSRFAVRNSIVEKLATKTSPSIETVRKGLSSQNVAIVKVPLLLNAIIKYSSLMEKFMKGLEGRISLNTTKDLYHLQSVFSETSKLWQEVKKLSAAQTNSLRSLRALRSYVLGVSSSSSLRIRLVSFFKNSRSHYTLPRCGLKDLDSKSTSRMNRFYSLLALIGKHQDRKEGLKHANIPELEKGAIRRLFENQSCAKLSHLQTYKSQVKLGHWLRSLPKLSCTKELAENLPNSSNFSQRSIIWRFKLFSFLKGSKTARTNVIDRKHELTLIKPLPDGGKLDFSKFADQRKSYSQLYLCNIQALSSKLADRNKQSNTLEARLVSLCSSHADFRHRLENVSFKYLQISKATLINQLNHENIWTEYTRQWQTKLVTMQQFRKNTRQLLNQLKDLAKYLFLRDKSHVYQKSLITTSLLSFKERLLKANSALLTKRFENILNVDKISSKSKLVLEATNLESTVVPQKVCYSLNNHALENLQEISLQAKRLLNDCRNLFATVGNRAHISRTNLEKLARLLSATSNAKYHVLERGMSNFAASESKRAKLLSGSSNSRSSKNLKIDATVVCKMSQRHSENLKPLRASLNILVELRSIACQNFLLIRNLFRDQRHVAEENAERLLEWHQYSQDGQLQLSAKLEEIRNRSRNLKSLLHVQHSSLRDERYRDSLKFRQIDTDSFRKSRMKNIEVLGNLQICLDALNEIRNVAHQTSLQSHYLLKEQKLTLEKDAAIYYEQHRSSHEGATQLLTKLESIRKGNGQLKSMKSDKDQRVVSLLKDVLTIRALRANSNETFETSEIHFTQTRSLIQTLLRRNLENVHHESSSLSKAKKICEKYERNLNNLRQQTSLFNETAQKRSEESEFFVDMLFQLCNEFKYSESLKSEKLCNIYRAVKLEIAQRPNDLDFMKFSQRLIEFESGMSIEKDEKLSSIQAGEGPKKQLPRKHKSSKTSPCFVS